MAPLYDSRTPDERLLAPDIISAMRFYAGFLQTQPEGMNCHVHQLCRNVEALCDHIDGLNEIETMRSQAEWMNRYR